VLVAKGEADVLLALALNIGAGDFVLASELLYSALVAGIVALPLVQAGGDNAGLC
jgi:hypothetical protein